MPLTNYILLGDTPDGQAQSFVLKGGCMTIGRQGDILLHHASVSRHHAQLECRDEGWLLSDLGSRNGTMVNGVSVQRTVLVPGDIVSFGRLKMKFEVEGGDDNDEAETSVLTTGLLPTGELPASAVALVGRSEALQQAMRLARRAAKSDATVLIFGESGTGKELFSKLVFEESARRDKPFIPVHSSAIEPNLLGSTLFGYEKGAFTGAVAQKKGLFEEADGGTIFLDEIGELSADMQVKLLRVLQEGEFMRVGGTAPIHVNVRVICATNRDLAVAVKEGTFREDLYYRLNVIQISLPPLRERAGDVPDLVNHFIDLLGGRVRGISAEAMAALVRYPWPGNVRELRNVIERSLVLSEHDRLELSDFPPEIVKSGGGDCGTAGPGVLNVPMPQSAGPGSLGAQPQSSLADIEAAHIRSVLEACGGNKKLAAERLGISRSTLYEKIKGCPISGQESPQDPAPCSEIGHAHPASGSGTVFA